MSDRQVISERPHTPISDYKKKKNRISISDHTKLSDNQNHIHIKFKITNGQVIIHSATTPNCFDNCQRPRQITDYKQTNNHL